MVWTNMLYGSSLQGFPSATSFVKVFRRGGSGVSDPEGDLKESNLVPRAAVHSRVCAPVRTQQLC